MRDNRNISAMLKIMSTCRFNEIVFPAPHCPEWKKLSFHQA